MKNLILTIQFLTRIPIPISIDIKEDSFAKGIIYFPIVGAIIGMINAGVYWGISRILGGMVPVICAILTNILLTGALHIDGLADTCDGIYSARNKERMLEIMKDSRIGTNGVVAIMFDILLRIAILSTLSSSTIIIALLISPIVSRTMMIVLISFSVYARESGLGALYLNHKNKSRSLIGIMIGLVLLLFTIKLRGGIVFLISIISTMAYRQHIYSKINGLTGDTLGAANEIIEVVSLFSIAMIERVLIL